MQEKEIIELIKAKDPRGAEEFLRNYSPLVRYVIGPIIKDEQDREECVSDVCMRVWERIESFDAAKGSFTTRITAIARNLALNMARRKVPDSGGEEINEEIPDSSHDPETEVLRNERLQALNEALKKLRKKDRLGYMLFYRKYYYRQPTAQIAAELGLTERAVEGRLYRIKQKLKNLLEGELS